MYSENFGSTFFQTEKRSDYYSKSLHGFKLWPLLKEVKKTVVFFGIVDEENNPHFTGTGFLVNVEGHNHLVTAKHVIFDKKKKRLKDQNMKVFLNTKDLDVTIAASSLVNLKEKYGVNWVFHENEDVDVAIIPFGLRPGDDVKTIPNDLFVDSSSLAELYDVFFLAYQPGIEPKTKIEPIVRIGTISHVVEGGIFYIDGAVFPGNSGSPVFFKPSPIRYSETGISIGGDELGGKFVGVIGAYVPYREIARSDQTGEPRVIFEENTGLSIVWSVDILNEIINSEKFKEQVKKLPTKKN